MLKGLVVAFHRGHPVVTKRNGGYPITLGRRVHLAGETCVGEVTNKHVVRPNVLESLDNCFLNFSATSLKDSGLVSCTTVFAAVNYNGGCVHPHDTIVTKPRPAQ